MNWLVRHFFKFSIFHFYLHPSVDVMAFRWLSKDVRPKLSFESNISDNTCLGAVKRTSLSRPVSPYTTVFLILVEFQGPPSTKDHFDELLCSDMYLYCSIEITWKEKNILWPSQFTASISVRPPLIVNFMALKKIGVWICDRSVSSWS